MIVTRRALVLHAAVCFQWFSQSFTRGEPALFESADQFTARNHWGEIREHNGKCFYAVHYEIHRNSVSIMTLHICCSNKLTALGWNIFPSLPHRLKTGAGLNMNPWLLNHSGCRVMVYAVTGSNCNSHSFRKHVFIITGLGLCWLVLLFFQHKITSLFFVSICI